MDHRGRTGGCRTTRRPPRPARAPTVLLLALLALAAGTACRRDAGTPARAPKLEAGFLAMGGIPIHVRAWDADPVAFAAAVDGFRVELERQESILSVHRAGSTLSRLNGAGGAAVPVAPDTLALLELAAECAAETGGAFDPTVGPLLAAWKEAARSGVEPTAERIAAARASVGMQRVHADDDGRSGGTVRLEPPTTLDLGGIAKGWFADLGLARLRAAGLRRGLVELGGDLSAYDDRPQPEPFRVGVRDPSRTDGFLGTLAIDGGSVVTSGDYERGYDVGGRHFNHIIDPRSGRPASGLRAVTLQAPTGARADALATAVMVLGERDGWAFLARTPDAGAVLVVGDPAAPDGLRIRVTPDLRERFEPDAARRASLDPSP
ncbi:MAG: FAD:protein FMN transferase [Deltaproteobacteria bacterium]|nr:FAD:protein FMN transferase [Deltaproteobacteria bacterium]